MYATRREGQKPRKAHDDLVMAIAIAHECAKQVIFNDFSEERELTEEESLFEF